MPQRITSMTAKDSEALVVHLGTNDILNASSEGQALLRISDALEDTKKRSSVPIIVCAVPPLKDNRANRIRTQVNHYLRHHCEKSRGKLLFVDPGLNRHDLERDGIHLTSNAKDLLCGSITAAAVGFLRDPYRATM